MTKQIIITTIILLAVSSTVSAGKPFNLFSPDRNYKPVEAQKKAVPPPKNGKDKPKPAGNSGSIKKFTLLGTTIVGKKRYARIKEIKGKEFVVRAHQGRNTPFPADPRYQLVEITPREIKIRYPIRAKCVSSDKSLGIECIEDGRYALLSLVAKSSGKQPAISEKDVKQSGKQSNIIGYFPDTKSEKQEKKKKEAISNLANMLKKSPEELEQLKMARLKELESNEAYQKRKKQYKNFKPRKIVEEDVPPGMKIMSTPFGDTLIQDKD